MSAQAHNGKYASVLVKWLCGVVYVNWSMSICWCLSLHHTSSHTLTFSPNSFCFLLAFFLSVVGCPVSMHFLLSTHFKSTTKRYKSLYFYHLKCLCSSSNWVEKRQNRRKKSFKFKLLPRIIQLMSIVGLRLVSIFANGKYSCRLFMCCMAMCSALRVVKFTEPKW